ncbi:MAG: hypothetical protein Q9219_007360 [cf. Caloplaca sp. 3 TL-2023]
MGLRLVTRDEKLVRWFFEKGADPNAAAECADVTPFSYAVRHATLDMVKFFFEQGGLVTRGNLIWHAATRRDDDPDTIPILQLLVDKGAAVDKSLNEGNPDLHIWAIAQASKTPLWMASEYGNTEIVRFLLANGADVNKGGVYNPSWGACPPPIKIAERLNHEEIVKLLTDASSRADNEALTAPLEAKMAEPASTIRGNITAETIPASTSIPSSTESSVSTPATSGFWAALGWK